MSNRLEESMKISDFVFDCVNIFLHNKRHKINLKHGGSCTDSPNFIKSKINK